MAWSANAVSASVPLTLVASTVQAASRLAARQAADGISGASVAAWAKGMVQAMSLTNLKYVAVLLAVGAISSRAAYTK